MLVATTLTRDTVQPRVIFDDDLSSVLNGNWMPPISPIGHQLTYRARQLMSADRGRPDVPAQGRQTAFDQNRTRTDEFPAFRPGSKQLQMNATATLRPRRLMMPQR